MTQWSDVIYRQHVGGTLFKNKMAPSPLQPQTVVELAGHVEGQLGG